MWVSIGMAGGTRGEGEDPGGAAPEGDLSARLRRLGNRLEHAEAERPSASSRSGRQATDGQGFARGMRLSAELVGGVLVGAGLGWFFDRALGTSPWGFIVFFLVGFAAGVVNVVRSAGASPSGSGRG